MDAYCSHCLQTNFAPSKIFPFLRHCFSDVIIPRHHQIRNLHPELPPFHHFLFPSNKFILGRFSTFMTSLCFWFRSEFAIRGSHEIRNERMNGHFLHLHPTFMNTLCEPVCDSLKSAYFANSVSFIHIFCS